MNLITTFRLVGNIAVVAVIGLFLFQLLIVGPPISDAWPWIIGGVAFGAGILQTVLGIALPKQAALAYDELNMAADRASYIWGYWITLAVFIGLLVLVLTERIQPMLAFGLIGAPLAHLRGRAG